MTNEEVLELASDALKLAHRLNNHYETDGDPCRTVFRLATDILKVSFGDKVAQLITEMATDSGEFDARDLLEYWKSLKVKAGE